MAAGKKPTWMKHARAAYRSGLEATICASLVTAGVSYAYEAYKVPFTQPAKGRNYTPDITLSNGIVVEVKGLFVAEDREKHLLVKAQHPDLDIRFVFQNPSAKLYKGSPTTYADWATKHGYRYSKKEIPQAWIQEPPSPVALAALATLGWQPCA